VLSGGSTGYYWLSDFSPNISITIQGNADHSTVAELEARLPIIIKKAYDENMMSCRI